MENNKTYQDSFTIGTPGSKGAIKIYFNVDDWKESKCRIARGLLLHQMFCNGELDISDLARHGDVVE